MHGQTKIKESNSKICVCPAHDVWLGNDFNSWRTVTEDGGQSSASELTKIFPSEIPSSWLYLVQT